MLNSLRTSCWHSAALEGAAAPVGLAPMIAPEAAPAVVEAVEVPSIAPANFVTTCASVFRFR